MDTREFLSLILPSSGLYVAAKPARGNDKTGKPFDYWKHELFKSVQGMALWMQDADAQGLTVYHGCSTLKEKFITVDGKKKVRVFDNIAWARCFWLDIDCGPGKDYPTPKIALKELEGFLKKTGLPTPLIVASGGGLHLYWPLDKDITADVWKSLAERFKAIVAKAGFFADRSRTSDVCSILRPVGTTNRKEIYGPQGRPVRVLNPTPIKITSYPDWTAHIDRLEGVFKLEAPKMDIHDLFGDGSKVKKLDVGLSEHVDIPSEVDPKQIVTSCNQFKEFAKAKGDVKEPYWFASLALIRHMPNGVKLAHRLSAGHPEYSEDATNAKLDHLTAENIGPTLCERFEMVNPGGCDKCEYKGQIKSPITLGRVFKAAPPPEVTLGGTTVTIPNPPDPYTRSENGSIIIVQTDASGAPMAPKVVYEYDLYPIGRVYDATHKEDTVLWQVHLPIDGMREFSIPLSTIYDRNAVTEVLSRAGVLVQPGKPLERLVNYIIAYICQLQKTQKSIDLVARMGWQGFDDEQFVLGYKAYRRDGMAVPVPKSLMEKNVAADRYVGSKGDLAEWKDVISTYGRKGQEPFAFAFLAAFGAPILKLTGFDGGIISIIDEGGTGKTTMQQAVMSVYGAPENKDVLITPQDTEKTVIAKLAALSNLPVILDDFSGTDEKDIKALADLFYAVSQGKGRDRLNQDGTISDRRERWSTVGVLSSNRSTYTRLHNYRGQATAESMRVFEYRGPKREDLDVTPAEARQLFKSKLSQNYGLAGPVFVAYITVHRELIRTMLIDCMTEIEKVIGENSAERFWTALIAACIVGGRIARMLELLPFDVERVLEWVLSQIVSTRAKVDSFKATDAGFISEFLHDHVDQIAILNNGNLQNTLRGKIVGRVDIEKNRCCISASTLRDYSVRKGVDLDSIAKALKDQGVLRDRRFDCCITTGTGIVAGSVKTWRIDISKQAFTGGLELVTSQLDVKVKKELDSKKKAS